MVTQASPESTAGRHDPPEQRLLPAGSCSLCLLAKNTRRETKLPNALIGSCLSSLPCVSRLAEGGTRTLVPDADGFIFRPSVEACTSLLTSRAKSRFFWAGSPTRRFPISAFQNAAEGRAEANAAWTAKTGQAPLRL